MTIWMFNWSSDGSCIARGEMYMPRLSAGRSDLPELNSAIDHHRRPGGRDPVIAQSLHKLHVSLVRRRPLRSPLVHTQSRCRNERASACCIAQPNNPPSERASDNLSSAATLQPPMAQSRMRRRARACSRSSGIALLVSRQCISGMATNDSELVTQARYIQWHGESEN